VVNLLDTPVEVGDSPDAQPVEIKQGEIVLSNVSFKYRPELPEVLDDITPT